MPKNGKNGKSNVLKSAKICKISQLGENMMIKAEDFEIKTDSSIFEMFNELMTNKMKEFDRTHIKHVIVKENDKTLMDKINIKDLELKDLKVVDLGGSCPRQLRIINKRNGIYLGYIRVRYGSANLYPYRWELNSSKKPIWNFSLSSIMDKDIGDFQGDFRNANQRNKFIRKSLEKIIEFYKDYKNPELHYYTNKDK